MDRHKLIVYLDNEPRTYYYEIITPDVDDLHSPFQYRIHGHNSSVLIDGTGKQLQGMAMHPLTVNLLLAAILHSEMLKFSKGRVKRLKG